ncbi:MAG: hypothetical protein IPJ01_10230 [Micavibrio sp.]|nr:hypothetical protein [Micavibrio sp.]
MANNKEYSIVKKVFRVWDGQRMHYDGSIQFDMFPKTILESTSEKVKSTFFEFDGIESGEMCVGKAITTFETMQYFGKYDINHKKIFEGDIIKFKDPSSHENLIYGQVVFNHDDCQFEVKNLKRWTYHDKSFSYNDHEFCRIYEMEVVGNIYENPNMLIEYDDIPKEKVKK